MGSGFFNQVTKSGHSGDTFDNTLKSVKLGVERVELVARQRAGDHETLVYVARHQQHSPMYFCSKAESHCG